MKSFSPAGAATKAYFGLGARTFGNPGGAIRGDGSFHGGGGGGPTPNLIIRSDAGAQLVDVAAGGAPSDQILGDFSSLIGLTPGLYFALFAAGPDMVMRAFCSIGQFAFTNILIVPFAANFPAAGAVFAAGCGLNQWTWVGQAAALLPLTAYPMVIT